MGLTCEHSSNDLMREMCGHVDPGHADYELYQAH